MGDGRLPGPLTNAGAPAYSHRQHAKGHCVTGRLRWTLIVCALLAAGAGAAATVDWRDAWSRLEATVGSTSETTRVATFRLGEVLSIEVALKDRYAAKVDVSYEPGPGERVLQISFRERPAVAAERSVAAAREIAAFAVGQTARSDEIDVVEVRFPRPDGPGGTAMPVAASPYRFGAAELVRTP